MGLKKGEKIKLPKVDKTAQEEADRLLAVMAIRNGSLAAAAEELGISASSAYQRGRTPGYRRAYNELLRDITAASTTDLMQGLADCLDTLEDLLKSENEWVRLGAVKTWISTVMKFKALEQIETDRAKDANMDCIALAGTLEMFQKWGKLEYESTDDGGQDDCDTEPGCSEYGED